MSNRSEIIGSFTRIMFVQAYASFVDRCYEDKEDTDDLPQAGSGEDWMDHSPATPPECTAACLAYIAEIEAHTGVTVEALYWSACMACNREGHTCRKHSPDAFGSDMAMQFVGTGVAWNDDHAMRLDLPYSEGYLVCSRTEAGLPETDPDVCGDCGEPPAGHC